MCLVSSLFAAFIPLSVLIPFATNRSHFASHSAARTQHAARFGINEHELAMKHTSSIFCESTTEDDGEQDRIH